MSVLILINLEKMQRVLMDLMQGRRGSIVAMDPDNGDILALVSSPAYDPNPFVNGIDSRSYKALLSSRDTPLINRALSGKYPPGSTVKPFISTSTQNIKDIVPAHYDTVKVVSPNGGQVSATWTGLWDGTLDDILYNLGVMTVYDYWWSGSNLDGTTAVDTCGDWGNAGVNGMAGHSQYPNWIAQAPRNCGTPIYAYLCIAY